MNGDAETLGQGKGSFSEKPPRRHVTLSIVRDAPRTAIWTIWWTVSAARTRAPTAAQLGSSVDIGTALQWRCSMTAGENDTCLPRINKYLPRYLPQHSNTPYPLRPYSVHGPQSQLKPTMESRVDRHEGIPGPSCVSGRGKLGDPAFRLKCWLGVGFTATWKGPSQAQQLASLPAMRRASGEGNLGRARWVGDRSMPGSRQEAARNKQEQASVHASQHSAGPARQSFPAVRACCSRHADGPNTVVPGKHPVLPRCYPFSINVH